MEQEEEEEVHIREAIEAQQREGQLRSNHTIPVPEIQELDISSVRRGFGVVWEETPWTPAPHHRLAQDKPPFEVPADYIHHQIYMQDPDRTDYDMDDDDVAWLKQFNAQRETPLDEYTFETMMHRLEQNTLHGIIKDEDIPPYLQTDSETAAAVRDYFQQKLSELVGCERVLDDLFCLLMLSPLRFQGRALHHASPEARKSRRILHSRCLRSVPQAH